MRTRADTLPSAIERSETGLVPEAFPLPQFHIQGSKLIWNLGILNCALLLQVLNCLLQLSRPLFDVAQSRS